ncbi:MAG: PAS domain S-box protein [Thermonemataceae bacterium]|nr:PAS domain S-box protein [Thermonemataceae bacterium]
MEDFELLEKIGERLVDEHLNVKEENFRLKEILDNEHVVPFVIDKKGFFILPNKYAMKAMGIQAKKLKTKNAYEFFERNPKAVENIRRALKGESIVDVLKLDGKYWKVSYKPTYDEARQIIGITGLSIDVTDVLENAKKILSELK